MLNRARVSRELSCQLRTCLRRVFLRIHPDKFWDLPTQASANKLAFQQLNNVLENLEANSRFTEATSWFTCYLREAGDICLGQGAQVEKLHNNLFKLTIQIIEDSRFPSGMLLLLRVLEAFGLEIPASLTDLLKEFDFHGVNSRSETLDDFIEKNGGLSEAHMLQSTFFSKIGNRRNVPTTSNKIFGLCRQLESKIRIYIQVECPNEEIFYEHLLRLKNLLDSDQNIRRKVRGCRIILKTTDCSFLNPETGVVTLGINDFDEEWGKTLLSSENIYCCEVFSQLDNRIRKQERIVERVLKVHRIFCSKEILWNRFYLGKYDNFLISVANGSIFQTDSLVYYKGLFEGVKLDILQLIVITESEKTFCRTSMSLYQKIYLVLVDSFSQMIIGFAQQLEQLSDRWLEQQEILKWIERLKAHLELLLIEFDDNVPPEERLGCLQRLDQISVGAKQHFKSLHLYISDKYEISSLTGRVSIPYFFECRELDKFLCHKTGLPNEYF